MKLVILDLNWHKTEVKTDWKKKLKFIGKRCLTSFTQLLIKQVISRSGQDKNKCEMRWSKNLSCKVHIFLKC